jgi:hypothetical protein
MYDSVPFTIHQSPSTSHQSPFTIHHPPSTIHHSPSTIHHSPSTIHHPPSTIHHPPSTIHHPPFTIHHPPSTIHHPPSTIHQSNYEFVALDEASKVSHFQQLRVQLAEIGRSICQNKYQLRANKSQNDELPKPSSSGKMRLTLRRED